MELDKERQATFARLRSEDAVSQAEELSDEAEASVAEEPVVAAGVVSYAPNADHEPVRLRYPFTIDGIDVSSVHLLPPASGDVEAVLTGTMPEAEMHARMAGLPIAALRAMRWPDRERVTLLARYLAPDLSAR